MSLDDIHHLKIGKICQEDFNMKMAYMSTNLVPESITDRNLKLVLKSLFSKFLLNNLYELIIKLKFLLLNIFNSHQKKIQFKFDFSIIGGNSGIKINAVSNSKKIIKSHSYDLESRKI